MSVSINEIVSDVSELTSLPEVSIKVNQMVDDPNCGVNEIGKVIVGQIGDLKREIVYNGDVLNTTSRIQDLCNKYNQELLVSKTLLSQLKLSANIDQDFLGNVKLRGKEKDIQIYGISQRS